MPAVVLAATPESIRRAADVLRGGGLVVFPTDTVYGLGVDPQNAAAVARIYDVKGREARKPLQLLLQSPDQLGLVARELSPLARKVADRFFPGGITLVVRRSGAVPAEAVAGGDTVGVRVPGSRVCLALVEAFGRPLAATSANLSGGPSPRTAEEALGQIGELIDLVLDGGPCPAGIDSTVLDATGESLRVLREGAVAVRDIEEALGVTVAAGERE